MADQIRCIGNDAALRDEVLKQARRALDGELTELNSQRRQIEKELAWQHAEILKLAIDGAAGSGTTARIADLHDRITRGEARLAEIRDEVAQREREQIEPQQVDAALAEFDGVWDSLSPREQAQLIALLVARVEFDAADSTIEISFHPSAIKALAERQFEEAA